MRIIILFLKHMLALRTLKDHTTIMMQLLFTSLRMFLSLPTLGTLPLFPCRDPWPETGAVQGEWDDGQYRGEGSRALGLGRALGRRSGAWLWLGPSDE